MTLIHPGLDLGVLKIIEDDYISFSKKDDSLQHRIWKCEFFDDIRQTVPQHITQFWRSQPECTRFHAWFIEDWTDSSLRRALYSLQANQSHQVPPGLPDVLHLFSDGGCKNPTNPRLRVAGWAFCVAMLPNDEFQPVASGLLPGLLQTPLRAEIKAAVEAIRFAVLQGKKFYLWTDNKHVFEKSHAYIKGATAPGPKQSNHDLWNALHRAIQAASSQGLLQQVVKVVSHADIQQIDGMVDRWVIRGNHAVDRHVNEALDRMPAHLAQALHSAQTSYSKRHEACVAVHKFFTVMGQRALSYKQDIREKDDSKWEEVQERVDKPEDHPLSFVPFPVTLQLPAEHPFGECAQTMFSWLAKLVGGIELYPCGWAVISC